MAAITQEKIEADTRKRLVDLLKGGNAHVSFQVAIKDINPELRSKKIEHIPYTIWQLVEHIRIAQWDMLEFSRNSKHRSPKWPEEYWPKDSGPESARKWSESIQQIADDRRSFISMIEDEKLNLFQPFPHGDGQNLMHEAMLIADHTSYHTGEIVLVRRLLKDWK